MLEAEHRAFAAGHSTKNGGCERIQTNPAVSEKQRRFMGAELGRLRAGKKTKSGMNERQLEEFARR
jgi:hypothetical protein